MRFKATFARLLVVLVLASGSAQAATILDVSAALSLSDPIQLGRLSRNAIQQDWAGSEPFPGVINPTTPYHYRAFLLNVGLTPYIQINFDSISANTFVSAYQTSYRPNTPGAPVGGPNYGFDVNWLGDAGVSGTNFGNPLFFQVLVPQNFNLLVIVNNTGAADLGVGDPFRLLVEGFVDSQFTEPGAAVPEPASLLLGSLGFAAVALHRRARQRSR
jgi:PEP-CTERM motif-containing protein